MRKSWLLLPLAIVIGACNGSETNSANTSSTGTVPSNSPTTNTPPSPTTGTNNAASNDPAADPMYNPSRVHQTKDLKKIKIKVPKGELELWVMDNEEKTREGMMFLTDREVKDNEGMIFVFKDLQLLKDKKSFWMHNTILPLDIDYISKDKKIVNIGKGMPMNDNTVDPEGDYLYVIELKQGMTSKFGLSKGSSVAIPADLKGQE